MVNCPGWLRLPFTDLEIQLCLCHPALTQGHTNLAVLTRNVENQSLSSQQSPFTTIDQNEVQGGNGARKYDLAFRPAGPVELADMVSGTLCNC